MDRKLYSNVFRAERDLSLSGPQRYKLAMYGHNIRDRLWCIRLECITIANSDFGAAAYAHSAIDQA